MAVCIGKDTESILLASGKSEDTSLLCDWE